MKKQTLNGRLRLDRERIKTLTREQLESLGGGQFESQNNQCGGGSYFTACICVTAWTNC